MYDLIFSLSFSATGLYSAKFIAVPMPSSAMLSMERMPV